MEPDLDSREAGREQSCDFCTKLANDNKHPVTREVMTNAALPTARHKIFILVDGNLEIKTIISIVISRYFFKYLAKYFVIKKHFYFTNHNPSLNICV